METKHKHWELRKLLEAVEREWNWKPLKPLALKKVTDYLHGIEKPSQETLDKISLFVGFQDWQSFKDALHGDADATTNFLTHEEDKKHEEDCPHSEGGKHDESDPFDGNS